MAWASLEFDNGISACINLSWFYPLSTASVTVIGSKGAIHYEGRFQARKVSIYKFNLGSPPEKKVNGVPSPNIIPINATIEEEITAFGNLTPLELACQHFLECIEEKKEPISSGQSSLKVLHLLETGDISNQKGGIPVTIPRGAHVQKS